MSVITLFTSLVIMFFFNFWFYKTLEFRNIEWDKKGGRKKLIFIGFSIVVSLLIMIVVILFGLTVYLVR